MTPRAHSYGHVVGTDRPDLPLRTLSQCAPPLVDSASNTKSSLARVLMLPNTKYQPTVLCEEGCCLCVASPISADLLRPVPGVRPGCVAVLGTTVPEASVEEYRDALSRKHDIRRTS